VIYHFGVGADIVSLTIPHLEEPMPVAAPRDWSRPEPPKHLDLPPRRRAAGGREGRRSAFVTDQRTGGPSSVCRVRATRSGAGPASRSGGGGVVAAPWT